LDASCTQLGTPEVGALYFDIRSGALPYVADVDSTGAVTAIHQATVEVFSEYRVSQLSPGCAAVAGWGKYILGAQVPLTDFVKMQVVTE
jgi:hypothetical protein